jgi:hypothetical protein
MLFFTLKEVQEVKKDLVFYPREAEMELVEQLYYFR